MDAFSIAVSIGLQYGVPLETYVSKFINMKFEPSGMTNDPDIRFASSLVDYVFRRLALDYLPRGHARGARHPFDRRAARSRRGTRSRPRCRPAPPSRSPAPELIPIDREAAAKILGRAALLLVRVQDAAGGLVLRVLELRQYQRLLVSFRTWISGTRRVVGLHHVQLAMPPGEEEAAVKFYG